MYEKNFGPKSFEREELFTILTEVEFIVNSRPLTASSEEERTHVLRPIDFLLPQGSGLVVSEPTELDIEDPEFLLPKDREAAQLIKLHKQAVHRVQMFWKLWLNEF